jgi:ERCC4-type nuclease
VLLVDRRIGSADLAAPLRREGLEVDDTVTLPFGDVAFMGRGEKGAPLFIGMELKRISDLIASLASDRLAGHQLPGLVPGGDGGYDRAWLIVEEDWTHDESGRVVRWKGKQKRVIPGAPQAADLEKRLFTLETRGGLHIRHSARREDTIRFIATYYRCWTDKDLDQHKSHLAIHAPDMDSTLTRPVSKFRKGLVGLVDGIGREMSLAIEKHPRVFNPETKQGSMRRLMLLNVNDLAAVEVVDGSGKTKKLGTSRAQKILAALG